MFKKSSSSTELKDKNLLKSSKTNNTDMQNHPKIIRDFCDTLKLGL
jgi:hypothetical protein